MNAYSKIAEPFESYTPDDLMHMTATIWGEARGECFLGKIEVAHVIRKRAELGGWYGKGIKGVCLKSWQFSCWNRSDPNFSRVSSIANNYTKDIEKTLGDGVIQECLTAALLALRGRAKPKFPDSTHYHTTSINPSWAEGKEAQGVLGHHKFYNNID